MTNIAAKRCTNYTNYVIIALRDEFFRPHVQ